MVTNMLLLVLFVSDFLPHLVEGKDVKTAEETKSLHVSYAPKNTLASVSRPSGLVSAGGWVELSCSSRAQPLISSFTWFKESQDGDMNVSQGEIYSFNATEGGRYYCVATNELGKGKSTTIHLANGGAEQLDGSSPWGGVVGGIIGITILICIAVAVWWLKSKHTTQEQSQGEQIRGEHETQINDTQRLTAVQESATATETGEEIHYGEIDFSKHRNKSPRVSEQDGGQAEDTLYAQVSLSTNIAVGKTACNIPLLSYPVNKGKDVKTAEETKTLHVSYAPKDTSASVSPSSGLVSAGGWVELSCSSRAQPPVSSFTWFKESQDGDMNVSQGEIYSFNATERGRYYCVATNELGNGKSTTIVLTMIGEVNFEQWGVVIGGTVGIVVLICLVLCGWRLISPHLMAEQSRSQTGEELTVEELASKTEIHYGEIDFSKQRNQSPPVSEQDGGQEDTLYAQVKVSETANRPEDLYAQVKKKSEMH
ncbi:hypothetical protein CesoFtcFv8_024883 [Champsocephalus esox]|uniref:Ig-like domain-containing protein n=1 Tax=Champsocephalus esox TaxID=159716 RepID=A0AAN8B2S3_9TELE|nr:hypothetical protein CesoFtcFv8_024883 [Champsocephalus esox]